MRKIMKTFCQKNTGGVGDTVHKSCFVCVQQCTIKSTILQLWS